MGKDSRDRAVECSGKTEKNKKEDMWLGSVVSVLKRGKNVNVPAEATSHKTNQFFSQTGEKTFWLPLEKIQLPTNFSPTIISTKYYLCPTFFCPLFYFEMS